MKRQRRVLSRIFIFVLVTACLISLALPVMAADDSKMLGKAKQGVVQIYGWGVTHDGYVVPWSGSGFAVGKAGQDSNVFVTNRHVITADDEFDLKETRIWILMGDPDFDEYKRPLKDCAVECEVLQTTDCYPDFAVIRALEPIQGYKALPLMPSDNVADGSKIYALGYPGVVDKQSVTHGNANDITITTGVVSQHMSMATAGNTRIILHDATITGGNSGGPLVTAQGAVVGINTYSFGEDILPGLMNPTDYSCAVSIDYAMSALHALNIPFDTYKPGPDTTTIILAAAGFVGAVLIVFLVVKLRKKHQKAPVQPVSPQPPAPAYRLRMPNGQQVTVPSGGVYLGRSKECKIRFPMDAKGISRIHCQLSVTGTGLMVTDLNSTYGTFVNGTKIPSKTPVNLQPGSRFYLGSEKYSFTVELNNQ